MVLGKQGTGFMCLLFPEFTLGLRWGPRGWGHGIRVGLWSQALRAPGFLGDASATGGKAGTAPSEHFGFGLAEHRAQTLGAKLQGAGPRRGNPASAQRAWDWASVQG